MSYWSIAEHTDTKLVAQTKKLPIATAWFSKTILAALIVSAYCPGIAALIGGSAVLPATAICVPSKTSEELMDCQVSRNLWGRVIRKQTEQLAEERDEPLELRSDGDTSLFYFGLFWLLGTTSSLVAIQALRVRKITWTFDRTAQNVQKQAISLIWRSAQTFDRANIHALQIEVPDLDLSLFPAPISVRLQLKNNEVTVAKEVANNEDVQSPKQINLRETLSQVALWQKSRPEIYATTHQELSKILQSTCQPIGAISDIPWQLCFRSSVEDGNDYYIFDFVDRIVNFFSQGKQLMFISFDEIIGFEVEEPQVVIDLENTLLQPEKPSVRYFKMVLKGGLRLQLHQYSGFGDVTNVDTWFAQLHSALTPYFPGVPWIITNSENPSPIPEISGTFDEDLLLSA
jgi:hypothetical protein